MFLPAVLAVLMIPLASTPGQAPRETIPPADVEAAIGRLGDLDFATRMEASRTIRRAAPAVALPLLNRAVAQHTDSYVRYRALVLLSGFNDPASGETMASVLGDRNDRLRAVAYAYFERRPEPAVLPRLLAALDSEESEFVRPALTRALVAYAAADPTVRKPVLGLALRGQDFFRSVVIEALGDHKATYAVPTLLEIAKLDGPLQDDAVLALGKIGDKKALETFVALQRSAPRNLQPAIAAAICLLGINCGAHQGYLASSLAFAIANPGFQDLLRATAAGLAALAMAGSEEAAVELIRQGGPTRDPERAAIALALGSLALRSPAMVLKLVEDEKLAGPGIELIHEAFDMLDEDFEEEAFFVAIRRAYWQSADGSPTRRAAEALIRRLEF